MIWLPAWFCDWDDENNFAYIENEKWYILINQWEIKYCLTLQEAIIQHTTEKIIENKNKFKYNWTTNTFDNELRDDYNNDGEIDKTTLTSKDKKSFKIKYNVKTPIKWLSATGYLKWNRYTWKKFTEKNWITKISDGSWWNIYTGIDFSYNENIGNVELIITANIEKNITKENAQIQYSIESWIWYWDWKYIWIIFDKDKNGDKNIGIFAEQKKGKFSINETVWYTYWNDRKHENWSIIWNTMYNWFYYWVETWYNKNNYSISLWANNQIGGYAKLIIKFK